MAKRGRGSILGRPMTGAERMRRYRWMQALFKNMCDRWRVRGEANWMRDGEPDMIAMQLADANFDWENRIGKYDRWHDIHSRVLARFAELEDEFRPLRHEDH
jgi:hypothetical protein